MLFFLVLVAFIAGEEGETILGYADAWSNVDKGIMGTSWGPVNIPGQQYTFNWTTSNCTLYYSIYFCNMGSGDRITVFNGYGEKVSERKPTQNGTCGAIFSSGHPPGLVIQFYAAVNSSTIYTMEVNKTVIYDQAEEDKKGKEEEEKENDQPKKGTINFIFLTLVVSCVSYFI